MLKRKRKGVDFSVIVIFTALVLIGVSLIKLLNIQLSPSHSLPAISVNYSWADASASIIEKEVTSPLEGLFNSIKGIEDVNSVTSRGSGRISLSFKEHVNIDVVRFEMATLIRQSYPNLPEQVSYPAISMRPSGQDKSTLLSFTLNSSASPHYIKKIAEERLVPKISAIEGVNEVAVYGSTPYEWKIEYRSQDLTTLDITVQDISAAIRTHFNQSIIGMVEVKKGDESNEPISLILKTNSLNENEWDIPIKKRGDRIVYLADVATVRFMEQEPDSYYRINGLNTINLNVYAEKSVNNIRTASDVNDLVTELKNELPPGYSVLQTYDATEFISKELNKIGLRTLFSIAILLVFVIVISRRLEYLLLITISLVANILVAVIFYYFFKLELHLYSLAGITVSFGIIIDNSIVMIDHYRYHKNKGVFLAILAATLTTIGSLCVIFFLKESQRANLTDFALVIIINLSVSLFIALFFIPALMQKIKLKTKQGKVFFKRKKRIVKFTNRYRKVIRFQKRFSWAFILLFILGFGIPVQWLPKEIEKEGFWPELYNKTIGGAWYQESIRPHAEKVLGGTLRLFSEYVFESSFYSDPERTTLYVRGTMPEGCTVQQLNEAVSMMENYISKFDEIEMFQTSVRNYRNSSIQIHFKEEVEYGSFPFYLKEELTSKAISLGGLDWSVYGVGRGFSNALGIGYKSEKIVLEGYNYERLYRYANELKSDLLKNGRIKEVDITGNTGWRSSALHEYNLKIDKERFALNEVPLSEFYQFLATRTNGKNLSSVFLNGELQPVRLVSDKNDSFNTWDLDNQPIIVEGKLMKMAGIGNISKKKTGNDIHKNNQQYTLVVAYDFIGPGQLARMVREKHIEQINTTLPLGYQAKDNRYSWSWDRKDKGQYYLIFLVIAIIYIICSIILESLLQPLAIIGLIPISFIGVFLTFYLFDINFDQGGFASFILLCGIVVNSGLYIINDYNILKKKRKNSSGLRLYLKAFNYKIIPVILTILSTVLGLVPFILHGQKEVFWFSFASGAMGGLLFSLVAILFYMPLFLRLRRQDT